MANWLNTPIQTQFRVIDGLSIRFAESEDRDDHALLLSPWPESLLAFEPCGRGSPNAPIWWRSTCRGSVIPSAAMS